MEEEVKVEVEIFVDKEKIGTKEFVQSPKQTFKKVFIKNISFGIGMASGAIPTYRALKQKQVDALRYE